MTQPSLLGLDACQVWNTDIAFKHLQASGYAATKRTAERRLHELGILPKELTPNILEDDQRSPPNKLVLEWDLDRARSKRKLVLFAQLHPFPGGQECLHANDARGGRYWIPIGAESTPHNISKALQSLQKHIGKDIAVFPHGRLAQTAPQLEEAPQVTFCPLGYPSALDLGTQFQQPGIARALHLKRLEAESIHILREAVAEADNPVMLYSVGKDSSVMLHLARKAFYPARPPFPLLHVDTRWKFQEMYRFRDHMARSSDMDLLVHINPEAIAKNINPFDHGSSLHTDVCKTEGLKQALNKHQFDVVFGGARRDEEKSRAKERIFSFRTATHHWDPKNQRPELWNLYNTQKDKGESIRVFPLSNWTELDIWQYIHQESIAVVPLYFAKERPVVVRDGLVLLVDDDRFRLLPGEAIQAKKVRFRTLGCYPLTGGVESDASTVPDIILELLNSSSSERQGRVIDADASASMEKKKQEGYF